MNITPRYKNLKELEHYGHCSLYSPDDYIYPSLKGFQIGDDDVNLLTERFANLRIE